MEVVITTAPPPRSGSQESRETEGGDVTMDDQTDSKPKPRKRPQTIIISDDDTDVEEIKATDASSSPPPSKPATRKPPASKKRKAEPLGDLSTNSAAKKQKVTSSAKGTQSTIDSDPWKLKTKDVKGDWREMRCPPMELFHFNRIVLDEYTYLNGIGYSLITNLCSTHRWVLSGTPPTHDFSSVKTIAAFMGIHLGVHDDFYDGQSKELLRELKLRQKKYQTGSNIWSLRMMGSRTNHFQTDAESFHSFREVHSLDWHAHRHEIAQGFLDKFVRQVCPPKPVINAGIS